MPRAPASLLCYNSQHNAVICRKCRSAYPFDKVDNHLSGHHKVKKRDRQDMIDALPPEARGATGCDSLRMPATGLVPVVRELGAPDDGLCCSECRYCCHTANAMSKHWRAEHANVAGGAERVLPAKIQTFYGFRQHRRWFPVDTGVVLGEQPVEVEVGAAASALEEEMNALEAPGRPLADQDDVIRSAGDNGQLDVWLQRTGWTETLSGVPASALVEFYRVARKVGDGDDEQHCYTVTAAAVGRLLDRQYKFLVQESTLLDRRALNQFDGAADMGSVVTKPFRIKQCQETLVKYHRVWSLFLQFVIAVERFERVAASDGRPLFFLTAEQKERLDGVLAAVDGNAANLVVEEAIREFFVSVLFHREGSTRSHMLVMDVFLAVLGFSVKTHGWHTPYVYGSMLMALVYGAQLQVFWAARHASEDQVERPHEYSAWSTGDLRADYTRALMRRYACNTSSSPMASVLTLNLYAHQLVETMIPRAVVTWSTAECIFVGEEQFSMADLQLLGVKMLRLVEGELCRQALFVGAVAEGEPIDLDSDAAALLLGEMMPLETMSAIKDNLSSRLKGWWFGQEAVNAALLQPVRRMLSSRLLRPRDPLSQFLEARVESGRVQVGVDAAERYKERLARFLPLLAVAVHILGGMPPRAPEIVGLRFKNQETIRHAFVRQGRVMLISTYNKSQNVTRRYTEVARVLPHRLSRVVLIYVLAVSRLQLWLDSRRAAGDPPQPHRPAPAEDQDDDADSDTWSLLGQDEDEHDEQPPAAPVPTRYDALFAAARDPIMKSRRYHTVFQRVVRQACGRRLRVMQWRHLVKAVGHVKLALGEVVQFATGFTGMEVVNGTTPMNESLDKQHGHSPDTGARIYGQSTELGRLLTMDALEGFSRVSDAWQRFLGVSEDVPTATGQLPPAAEPVTMDQAMVRLYGTPEFKSENQEAAVMAVFGPEPQRQVMVVLETGGGKSALFQLGHHLGENKVTVVIVPLIGLITSMSEKLEEVPHGIYGKTAVAGASVVLMSADLAGLEPGRAFVAQLEADHRLQRIVYDECHLYVTQANFREALAGVGNLQRRNCQHVYLTGTLPPSMLTEVAAAMRIPLDNLTVCRSPTARRRIRYHVEQLANEGAAVNRARELISGQVRALVYCRTRQLCVRVSHALEAGLYHGRIPEDERRRSLEEWQANGGVMVATTALGCGIDAQGVGVVVHVGLPWSTIDFCQESGRAGRGGEAADSYVLRVRTLDRMLPDDDVLAELVRMRGRRCRRLVLSEYLDGKELAVSCVGGIGDQEHYEECDVCAAGNEPAEMLVDAFEADADAMDAAIIASDAAGGDDDVEIVAKAAPAGQQPPTPASSSRAASPPPRGYVPAQVVTQARPVGYVPVAASSSGVPPPPVATPQPQASQPGGQFQQGAAPSGQFQQGAVPSGQFQQGAAPVGQFQQGQAPVGQFQQGQAPPGQFQQGAAPVAQFQQGQAPVGQFQQGQAPPGQFQQGAVPSGQFQGVQGGQAPVGQFQQGQAPVAQFQQGQAPVAQFQQGQAPVGQFQQGQAPVGQFQQGQAPVGQFQQGQAPPGQFQQGAAPVAQFQQGQAPVAQFQQGQAPVGQFQQGQAPPGQFQQGAAPSGQFQGQACQPAGQFQQQCQAPTPQSQQGQTPEIQPYAQFVAAQQEQETRLQVRERLIRASRRVCLMCSVQLAAKKHGNPVKITKEEQLGLRHLLQQCPAGAAWKSAGRKLGLIRAKCEFKNEYNVCYSCSLPKNVCDSVECCKRFGDTVVAVLLYVPTACRVVMARTGLEQQRGKMPDLLDVLVKPVRLAHEPDTTGRVINEVAFCLMEWLHEQGAFADPASEAIGRG